MAVIVPTSEEIIARFPHLDGREELIDAILPEAQLFMDDTWSEGDTKIALMYAVAHLIEAEDLSGAGTGGDVASESIGPISVSYRDTQSSEGIALWSSTLYGKRFLEFARRNRRGPVVIQGEVIC